MSSTSDKDEPVQPAPEPERDVPRDEPGVIIDEAEPGAASRRAVEDFDAVPGEEHVVDFPEAGHREGGIAQDVLALAPEVGYDLLEDDASAHMGAVDGSRELVAPRFGRLESYTPVPSLDIEITISAPDGRSFTFRESQEYPGFPDYDPAPERYYDGGELRYHPDQIAPMLEAVVESATDRFSR